MLAMSVRMFLVAIVVFAVAAVAFLIATRRGRLTRTREISRHP